MNVSKKVKEKRNLKKKTTKNLKGKKKDRDIVGSNLVKTKGRNRSESPEDPLAPSKVISKGLKVVSKPNILALPVSERFAEFSRILNKFVQNNLDEIHAFMKLRFQDPESFYFTVFNHNISKYIAESETKGILTILMIMPNLDQVKFMKIRKLGKIDVYKTLIIPNLMITFGVWVDFSYLNADDITALTEQFSVVPTRVRPIRSRFIQLVKKYYGFLEDIGLIKKRVYLTDVNHDGSLNSVDYMANFGVYVNSFKGGLYKIINGEIADRVKLGPLNDLSLQITGRQRTNVKFTTDLPSRDLTSDEDDYMGVSGPEDEDNIRMENEMEINDDDDYDVDYEAREQEFLEKAADMYDEYIKNLDENKNPFSQTEGQVKPFPTNKIGGNGDNEYIEGSDDNNRESNENNGGGGNGIRESNEGEGDNSGAIVVRPLNNIGSTLIPYDQTVGNSNLGVDIQTHHANNNNLIERENNIMQEEHVQVDSNVADIYNDFDNIGGSVILESSRSVVDTGIYKLAEYARTQGYDISLKPNANISKLVHAYSKVGEFAGNKLYDLYTHILNTYFDMTSYDKNASVFGSAIGKPNIHKSVASIVSIMRSKGLPAFKQTVQDGRIGDIVNKLTDVVSSASGVPNYDNARIVGAKNEYNALINPINKVESAIYKLKNLIKGDSSTTFDIDSQTEIPFGRPVVSAEDVDTDGLFSNIDLETYTNRFVVPACTNFSIQFPTVPNLAEHPIYVYYHQAITTHSLSEMSDLDFAKFLKLLQPGKFKFTNTREIVLPEDAEADDYVTQHNAFHRAWQSITLANFQSILNGTVVSTRMQRRIAKIRMKELEGQLTDATRVGNTPFALWSMARANTPNPFLRSRGMIVLITRVRTFNKPEKYIKFKVTPKLQYFGSILKTIPSLDVKWKFIYETISNKYDKDFDMLWDSVAGRPFGYETGSEMVKLYLDCLGGLGYNARFNLNSKMIGLTTTQNVYDFVPFPLGYTIDFSELQGVVYEVSAKVSSHRPIKNITRCALELILKRTLVKLFWAKKSRLQEISSTRINRYLKTDSKEVNNLKYFLGSKKV